MNDIIEEIFGKEIEETKKENIPIQTLRKANHCALIADNAFQKILEAEQFKEEAIEKINAWFEVYTKEYDDTIKEMKEMLEPWVWNEIKDKKSKSVKLLNGIAGFRKTQGSIQIKDERKMVQEAKEYSIPVQYKEYVNKTDIKKYIESTGHIPDNATVIRPVEKIYLKTKEEENET